jgi:hypothetical protein
VPSLCSTFSVSDAYRWNGNGKRRKLGRADYLTADKNRLGNRLRQQLWRNYPQVLELAADITAEWVLDLGRWWAFSEWRELAPVDAS